MHLFTKLSVLLAAATACASPARYGGPRRRDADDTSYMVSTVTVAPYPYLGTGSAPITPTYSSTGTGDNTALPTAVTGTGSATSSAAPTLVTITTTVTYSYKKVDGTSTTWVTTTTCRTITETRYHTQYVTIPEVPSSTADPVVTDAAAEPESTTTVTSTSTYFTTITIYPNESIGGDYQISVVAAATDSGCAPPVTVTVTEPGSTATVTVTASEHKPHHSVHPTYTYTNGTLPTSGMSGSGTVSIPLYTGTVSVDPTATNYRH